MRLVPVKFGYEFKMEQLILWLKLILESDMIFWNLRFEVDRLTFRF